MNNSESIDYYGVLKLKKDCNDWEIQRADTSMRHVECAYCGNPHSSIIDLKRRPMEVPVLNCNIKNDQIFRHLAIQYNVTRQKNEDIQKGLVLIAEAYEVLSDPLNRAIYDQYGETGLKRGVSRRSGQIPPYVFHGDPRTTFREFFGTSNPYGDLFSILGESEVMKFIDDKHSCKRNDKLLMIPLPLTLMEIFFGAVKKIAIDESMFINKEKTDTISEGRTFEFIVKPGLPTATKIGFIKEQDRTQNKIYDIVFVTEDIPHRVFKRQGDNLIMTVDIFLSEALVGTVVIVHTLDNRILRVPISAIITPDYEKCVLSEGLPLVKKPNDRGNLVINFTIEFPIYLPVTSKYYIKKGFGKMSTDTNDEQ